MIEKALKDPQISSLLLNGEYPKAVQLAFDKCLGQSSIKWLVDNISAVTGKRVRDLFEPIKNTSRFFQHNRIATECFKDTIFVYSNYAIFDADILVVIYYLYPNIVLDEMSIVFTIMNNMATAHLYLNSQEDTVFTLYNPPYVEVTDGELQIHSHEIRQACTKVVDAWLESVWASNFNTAK